MGKPIVWKTLSVAIDEYVAFRKEEGYAANTIRNDRFILGKFLEVVGDKNVNKLDSSDVDKWQKVKEQTTGKRTQQTNYVLLRGFFTWCRISHYMAHDEDPTRGRKIRGAMERKHTRLPAIDFDRLLDAADTPRDRMVLALGLHLLLRGGEIITLSWADVGLDDQEIDTAHHKVKMLREMPMSKQLQAELRRWNAWLTANGCPPEGHHFLVPRIDSVACFDDVGLFSKSRRDIIRPTMKMGHPAKLVNRALNGVGFPTRDAMGVPLREGAHTLRRSAARAFYDRLRRQGLPDAMRITQIALGHKTMAQTEKYIGMADDMQRLHDVVKGQDMFLTPDEAATAGNVVELRPAGEA